MSAQQRRQNRETARQLAREVYEANLPNGLTVRRGELRYECPRCGNDREWYGEDPKDFDPRVPCGGSERCIP